MALGKRSDERQTPMWVAAEKIASSPGSPFYRHLNAALAEAGFDRFVESICAKFYSEGKGRPGIPPGIYFCMLMIGYLEGLGSERGIAWRCADSLTLREFLGYELTESTPEHSTLSVIRKRIDVETHQEVFTWILDRLAKHGLVKGKTIGIDATTLEANAAMRSLVRRDDGRSYEAFLTDLAHASGIATPSRADLAKLDRKRKKKGSNDDWVNPHDPDARITKMKDGRTHLAHKAEHAVDMDTGATLAVTIQPGDRGDTTSIGETLCEVMENLSEVEKHLSEAEESLSEVKDATGGKTRRLPEEVVADKGYHSNAVISDLAEMELRSYVSEPDRGQRNWKGKENEQAAVYANRRRIRGERGKRLLRTRGELLERPFAHCYETGGMRRTHLRGHVNIFKRLLIHVATSNLGLLMRRLIGAGTPRSFQDLGAALRSLPGTSAHGFSAMLDRCPPVIALLIARRAAAPLFVQDRMAA
jgi:transposase